MGLHFCRGAVTAPETLGIHGQDKGVSGSLLDAGGRTGGKAGACQQYLGTTCHHSLPAMRVPSLVGTPPQ